MGCITVKLTYQLTKADLVAFGVYYLAHSKRQQRIFRFAPVFLLATFLHRAGVAFFVDNSLVLAIVYFALALLSYFMWVKKRMGSA